MTTKINITELLADRQAGTGGEWALGRITDLDGWDFYEVRSGTDLVCLAGDGNMDPITLEEKVNARRIARLPALEAAYIEAVEVLRRFAEVNSDACRRDHHGYCQSHFLEVDCMVAEARKFLGDGE